MALTVEVTKKSVSLMMDGAWNITLNLSILDAAGEVYSQDFAIVYKAIHDPEAKVKELIGIIQKAYDDYVAEQVIFNHQKLADAVTWINANLIT